MVFRCSSAIVSVRSFVTFPIGERPSLLTKGAAVGGPGRGAFQDQGRGINMAANTIEVLTDATDLSALSSIIAGLKGVTLTERR